MVWHPGGVRDLLPDGGTVQAAPQHWWSPAPAPDLPPISAKRAYGEVLFVFASFFLVGIIGAALLLANHYKSLEPSGSWALYITQAVDILISVGIALALVILFGERRGVTLGTLGVRMPRRPDGRVAAGLLTRIFAWGIFAQVLGGVINAGAPNRPPPDAEGHRSGAGLCCR